jgi:dipeptidyl aminopeptidase/acylaminoacyl peptidase
MVAGGGSYGGYLSRILPGKEHPFNALVIHGQLDYRVPVGQAFELFRTLQHRDVDSRLIYYPDENHWILKPNNSLYWYEQVRDWIGRYAEP